MKLLIMQPWYQLVQSQTCPKKPTSIKSYLGLNFYVTRSSGQTYAAYVTFKLPRYLDL
jgi:hypothetical protein